MNGTGVFHVRTGDNSNARQRLIGVNIALLAALIGSAVLAQGRTSPPPASGARTRGNYTVVSGRVQGSTGSVMYVFDAANQEIVAVRWDRNASRFETIGWRDVAGDSRQQQGGR
jgi:hypothetical protein